MSEPVLVYPGMNNPVLQAALRPLRTPRGRAIDRVVTRLTGWSFLCYFFQARAAGREVEPPALLTTIGAKTGALRSSVMSAWRDPDGPGWLLCGTNGGAVNDPQWVRNMRAEPKCWVRYRREDHPVRARELDGDDYARMHDYIAARHPKLEVYERSAREHNRHISIWRLSPVAA